MCYSKLREQNPSFLLVGKEKLPVMKTDHREENGKKVAATHEIMDYNNFMAPQRGLEPPTPRLGERTSPFADCTI